MFDLLGAATDFFAPLARAVQPDADAASHVCVDESYAATEPPDYSALPSMYFGDETGGDASFGDEYDPFGQVGREEDEENQIELDSTMDLDMVDDSDKVGAAAMFKEENPVAGFRGISSMVEAANQALQGMQLGTLSIQDHGSPGSQQVGDDRLTSERLRDPAVRDELAKLPFGAYGSVELGGCRVGGDEAGDQFLRDIARETGVPATGSNAYQSPLFDGYEGAIKTCYPPELDEETGETTQTCEVESHLTDRAWEIFSELGGKRPHSDMTAGETRVVEP